MTENHDIVPEDPKAHEPATSQQSQPISQPDEALYSPTHKGPIGKLLAPVAGFGVTFSTIFRPTVTEQYLPSSWSDKEKNKPHIRPRFHGMHKLNRYPDGLEKCIGCELCAWACPADAILVEAAPNTPEEQYSPGERYGRVYQINYLRCIFCGYCIQACPTRALTMSNEFEIAGQTREELIYEKPDLLRPLAQGMLGTPHPMAAGTSDSDYYAGKVSGPTQNQIDWVRSHRPDDPTLANVGDVVPGAASATQPANVAEEVTA